jgi:hypothetical protein
VLNKAYEDAVYAQQVRQYGASSARSLRNFGPPSTTSAFLIFISNNINFWNKFFTHTIPDMFRDPISPIKIIVRLIVILVIITIAICLWNYAKRIGSEGFVNTQSAVNKAAIRVNQLSGVKEGFQAQEKKLMLINLQPLTVKQAAYLTDVFDTNYGISQQLALGCRSFFFNIDYVTHDMSRDAYPRPYEPALIYRDNSGNLTSRNYGALDDAFKYLREYGFNDQIPNYTSPIIIFLHFIRTPDKLNETDKYVAFLKKVSLLLSVLNDRLMKEYYRSSKESDIFTQDFKTFDTKILIGTNIDTSYSKQLNAQGSLTLMEDLDYKINFHYYKEDSESIDATAISTGSVNALIVKRSKLLSLNIQERNDWLSKYKNKFIILKDEPMNNLNPAEVALLLNTFGVNVVPYDYINTPLADAKNVKNLYNGSWKLKPDILTS